MVEHDSDPTRQPSTLDLSQAGATPLAPVRGSLGRRAARRAIRAAPRWVRSQAVGRCRAAVVTGTGRCGTMHVTELLRALGVRAGHEAIYRTGGFCYMPDAQVDVSWMAAAHLDEITSPTAHLVRDPLGVISSLVGIRFFAKRHSAYTQFAYAHCDALGGDDELVDALRWYVHWNERIERRLGADRRVRIEDLRDAEEVERLLRTLRIDSTRAAVTDAIERTSTAANARARADVSWSDLRAHCETRDVEALVSISARYGYDPG